MKGVSGIILAAGKGTRLNNGLPSDIPKVLHLLGGRPLVSHCIDSLEEAGIKDIILVVGHKGYSVKEAVGNHYKYAVQDEQRGTAHAVLMAKDLVFDKAEHIIVLNGDNPLFSKDTISKLVQVCVERDPAVALVTVDFQDPKGYGRIIKDEEGHVLKIVEEKEASSEERALKEINAGCYCFNSAWLWDNIDKVKLSSQGEYYLTDLIGIAVKEGEKVIALKTSNKKEAIGVNTPEQLKMAQDAFGEL